MKKALIVLLMVLGFSFSAHAEDLYIAQAAAGAGTGANCGNALAYTFFNSSGNWGAGAGKISPGDTVHICGTVTGSGTSVNALTFQGSGTPGNVITLHFEPNAKLSNPAWPDSPPGAIDIPDNLAWLTIEGDKTCGYVNFVEVPCTEGIEDTNNGNQLGLQQASAAIYGRPVSHVTVRNLFISNLYVQNTAGAHGNQYGDAVHLGGDSNLIYNLEVHDTFQGPTIDYYVGSTNAEIRNLWIYRANWGITGSGHQTNAHMNIFKVHDNDISAWDNWDDPGNCCHHNGIFFQEQGASGTGIDGLQIYKNFLHGNTGGFMTGQVFLDCENVGSYCYPGAQVFTNIFQVSANGPANGQLTMGGQLYTVAAYSNTFYNTSNFGSRCIQWTAVKLTSYDNVFFNCGQTYFDQSGSGITAADYNTYWNSSFMGPGAFDNACGTAPACSAGFASWKMSTGFDAHGQAANPNLTNTCSTSSSCVPNAGSSVILFANNLTSLGITPLNTDLYTVSRPGGIVKWDGGVAQFAAGGSPAVSLSPTSIPFGNQTVTVPSGTQTITLTNPGSATLNITSITLTGADAARFSLSNGCGSTLAALGTCAVGVTFTPLIVTSYSASVTFTTDASTSPDNVTLTGSGVAASASTGGISGTAVISGSGSLQ